MDSHPRIEGTKWPNIITAEDHATGEEYCDLHLRIYFEPGKNRRQDVIDAITHAHSHNDRSLRKLKDLLIAEVERANMKTDGNVAVIEALRLNP